MDRVPHIEIPPQFCSEESGEPMGRCVVCGSHVLAREDPYVIDKAYRCGQLLYEAVMCWACLEWFETGQSRRSRHVLEQYMEANNYRDRHYEALLEFSAGRIEPWIANCGITGRSLAGADTYQYKAVGMQRDILLLPQFPMGMSSDAADEMWRLLSPESAQFWCQFSNDYLGVPPALMRYETLEKNQVN